MNDVINLGKIPTSEKLLYTIALKIYEKSKGTELQAEKRKELEVIVRRIERQMNIGLKIDNYIPSEWKYFIDDNYNFWILKNSYINRNFKIIDS